MLFMLNLVTSIYVFFILIFKLQSFKKFVRQES